MNDSIHRTLKIKFDSRVLSHICRYWLLISILTVPALSAFGQSGVDSSTNCARQMTRHFSHKGWVGITPQYDEDGSIRVTQVFADSPAEKAGIQEGDFIRGLNGQDRETAPEGFMLEYDSLRPNRAVIFDLEREGSQRSVSVQVETIPETVLEDWISEECQ